VINSNPEAGFKAIINEIRQTVTHLLPMLFYHRCRRNKCRRRMEHGQYAVNCSTETDPEKAKTASEN